MRRGFLALPLLLVLAPVPAQACSVIADHIWSPAEQRAAARRAIASATAIVDGEVIRPFVRGGAPALVRVHRRFKGPEQELIEVGERHSCDVALTATGERSRMILVGGPDVYFLDSLTNGSPHIVDRLLGSDRERDWPYVRGVEAAH